ncbi:hypothetical protein FM106_01885 [Brachybacterium faecium]|nr:hypothetical protein FM106_01885 [Brachybacterium faecium]
MLFVNYTKAFLSVAINKKTPPKNGYSPERISCPSKMLFTYFMLKT